MSVGCEVGVRCGVSVACEVWSERSNGIGYKGSIPHNAQ